MSTSAQQDKDFLGAMICPTLLEEAIEWIGNNMSPEDVFSECQLDEWAVDNEWVEAETL
jgi:hypothetical protein